VFRVNANDVVTAYKATGLIPIRKAWQSEDERGGCAIDALAHHIAGVTGEAWAVENLEPDYIKGFVDAWDEDHPKIIDEKGSSKNFLIGFWDAILCREAVEKAFSSRITEVSPHEQEQG
jgi:hypothetical protein